MNGLPDYEPQKLPTGQFKFLIADFTIRSKKNPDTGRTATTIQFQFKVDMGEGFRTHRESIGVWEDRYKELLFAIGAEKDKYGEPHLTQTVDVVGMSFKASIIHEKDANDPRKTWARIADIQIPEAEEDDIPPPQKNEEDDEVPF